MTTMILYAGRILLGGFFLFNAFHHFSQVGAMSGYAKMKGVPASKAAVLFSGILLLIGGLSIMLNLYPVIGLSALVLFLIPVTLKMHAFWAVGDANAKMGETVQFMKNMALLGAVLILFAGMNPSI